MLQFVNILTYISQKSYIKAIWAKKLYFNGFLFIEVCQKKKKLIYLQRKAAVP